ncbi:MAG: hypothetical protein ABW252_00565 [Polyangiales bacterium]
MMHFEKTKTLLSAAALAALAGCAAPDAMDPDIQPVRAQEAGEAPHGHGAGDCPTFASSYEAIQELIFERKGCTAQACHGEGKVGGLDLRKAASYAGLVDVPSANSAQARVQPGAPRESFLYQKLAAATRPGSVSIAGSPMPVGASALTESELEAVALWITKGAPETGTVVDATRGLDLGKLLEACVPPGPPVRIKPLEPPAPSEGVQIVMPKYVLKGNSEVENCTPFVYDLTQAVPAEFKDEKRNVAFVDSSRVRQDAQSHHMTVWNPELDIATLQPSDAWTCRGGDADAQRCDPRKGGSDCGGGVCAGKPMPGTLCGPGGGEQGGGLNGADFTNPDKLAELLADPAKLASAGAEIWKVLERLLTGGSALPKSLVKTQTPQDYVPPTDGVYWTIPLRGLMWFNSHAFNLQESDTELEARVNFTFAKKRNREMKQLSDASNVYIGAGLAPFQRKTYCVKHVVPQYYNVAAMFGHTHRRGERFWVKDPTGKLIYENFLYDDPPTARFDPWLTFDSPDPAKRSLEYCVLYNNGLTKDDKPDLELVTRASRMPSLTSCKPVACVAGKVAAACKVDSDCDSTPGRGDGDCDACPITAGTSTENEMFALSLYYVLPLPK